MNAFKTNRPGQEAVFYKSEHIERQSALQRSRKRMGKFFKENQLLGRKGAIGCVSLEISQRCNLDCSLCYLSPNSQQVQDLPLQELYRRLREAREQFGVGTNIQISGGDPTLRPRKELVALVKYARHLGLLPSLFTNGIKASRSLLEALAENGLSDVAFHVDMTQNRPGFNNEKELNAVREEYMRRAEGLPIMVIFNTTVFEGNFHEVPELVRFFLKHSNRVGMASFQLQAETGRGVLGAREDIISLETVRSRINQGSRLDLPWDTILVGHPKCHSYAPVFTINGNSYDFLCSEKEFAEFLHDFQHVGHDRRKSALGIAWTYFREMWKKPRWLVKGTRHLLPILWRARKDLWASRGKFHKTSFFIQNFMDAKNLDPERVEACSFMVMTNEGPVSMCAHNAERDRYILQPVPIQTENGPDTFYPLNGKKPVVS